MTATLFPSTHASLQQPTRPARLLMLSILATAAVSGFVLTGAESATQAVALAGEDLTRLLRAMALIKALIAMAATAGVVWRLGAPVTLSRFGVYGLTVAAMAAGPGLIWNMAHVGLGALLLHAGLFATLLLLWRDPAVTARLATLTALRRRT